MASAKPDSFADSHTCAFVPKHDTAYESAAISAAEETRPLPDGQEVIHLFNALPHPVMAVDKEGNVLYFNEAMRACCGEETPPGKACTLRNTFACYVFLQPSIRSAISNGEPVVHENVLVQSSILATCYTVTINPTVYRGTPVALVCLQEIAVAYHAIEDMLVQVQKSMLVSGFAAGMAHEVNSPLSVVFQGTQNMLRRLDPMLEQNRRIAAEIGCDLSIMDKYLKKRGILKTIETVRQSAERATSIIANMLGFSRQRDSKRSTVHIKELVARCLDLAMLDGNLKHAIQSFDLCIEQEYESYLPLLICHPTEIEQVLLNLIKNAIQAMSANPPEKPKVLRIAAKTRGTLLHIEIADSGPGISEEASRQIFEPFMTTKNVGSGTGLGLFIARHIVEGHHKGKIQLSSQCGTGTTFTLLLPFLPE